MSVRGEFRRALQEHLEQALDMRVVAGEIVGPVQDADIACVWWEGKRPFSRDGNVEENYYRVRVLHRFMLDQGAATPRDQAVEQLETTAEQLEEALRVKLAVLGHGYFNVTEVTADYRTMSVEAQLVAFDRNRSAAGG